MTHAVFLSHQTADKPTVRAVGQYLAEHSIEPILDEWTFRRGRSLHTEIEASIRRSTSFILFWSHAAASSKYVQFEDEIALARNIKDDRYVTQMVRLDHTPIPERHSFLIYHDWCRGKPGSKLFLQHLDVMRRSILGLPDKDPPETNANDNNIEQLLEQERSARFQLNLAWQEVRNWIDHSPDMRDQIEIFEDDVHKYEKQLREIRMQLHQHGYSESDVENNPIMNPTPSTADDTAPDVIDVQIESAEAFESIGDVWSAVKIYESLRGLMKEKGDDELAAEMQRRAKLNRRAAASMMRGDG